MAKPNPQKPEVGDVLTGVRKGGHRIWLIVDASNPKEVGYIYLPVEDVQFTGVRNTYNPMKCNDHQIVCNIGRDINWRKVVEEVTKK